MDIDHSRLMLLSKLPLQTPQRPMRTTHTRQNYDGRLVTVELSDNGVCQETGKEKLHPFQLLSSVLQQTHAEAMPEAAAQLQESIVASAEKNMLPPLQEKAAEEMSLSDQEATDVEMLVEEDGKNLEAPGYVASEDSSVGDVPPPENECAGESTHSELHKIVSQLLKQLVIQDSTATLQLDEVTKGMFKSTVSFRQVNGKLNIDLTCDSTDEEEWFGKNAAAIHSRLSERLKQDVKVSLNGEVVGE